jgi:hypothetical protein
LQGKEEEIMQLISTNRVRAKTTEIEAGPKTIVLSSWPSKDIPKNIIVARPKILAVEPGQEKPGAGPFITTQNMGEFKKAAMAKKHEAAAPKERKKRGRPKRAKK